MAIEYAWRGPFTNAEATALHAGAASTDNLAFGPGWRFGRAVHQSHDRSTGRCAAV